jgi:hypothetical protein
MKDSPGDIVELKELCDFNLAIVDYIVSIVPGESVELMRLFRASVESAYQQKNLRGMRMLIKDFTEWGRSLEPPHKDRLEELLQSRFGKGLSAYQQLNRMKNIIKRGKINTIQEYTFLRDYYEEFFHDSSKKKVLDELHQLIYDYELRTLKL